MRRTTHGRGQQHAAAAMVPTRNLLHHDGNSNRKSYYHPAGQYCAGGIATELEASAATAAARQGRKQPRSPSLATASDADELAAPGMSARGGAGTGDDGDWLQLGLATASSSSSTSSSGDNNSTAPAPSPMELDLFTSYDKRNARMMPPLFPLPLRSYGHGRFRKKAASGSMSAPFLPSMRPFIRSSGDGMRVISPPGRTEAAGLWLTLQAAPNQAIEPILPQIPKSYLRIKDSNIKVEMVMKYLADKLGLTRSHQVELTCRGQPLSPFLLVKFVRDSIWCSSSALREEEVAALAELNNARRQCSHAATTDHHVMTLCYSTSRNH